MQLGHFELFSQKISIAMQGLGYDVKHNTILENCGRAPAHVVGDICFPCFSFAKEYKLPPNQLSETIVAYINNNTNEGDEQGDSLTYVAVGPFVNAIIAKDFIPKCLDTIIKNPTTYGQGLDKNMRVLIESPGPNTNKPLHLGHLRNMLLGNTIASIMRYVGFEVINVDIINDRGIHICKSMLAYKLFGNNAEPDKKTDHFVGDRYVRYALAVQEDPSLEQQAQDMLRDWEAGDQETMKLWSKMNAWAISGQQITYARCGTHIAKTYFESDVYQYGKELAQEGLASGIFERDSKGNIVYITHRDTDPDKEKKLLLLRGDGTSVYATQDIALAKIRNKERSMDRMVYVVGNEQKYYFEQLFATFAIMGYDFVDGCFHLSYGHISLPDGKMKSREGNVVDTDTISDEMHHLAYEQITQRYPDMIEEDKHKKAESIAMAAIKFFFLKFETSKDFVFDKKASLSFEGETGPYIQYTYARCCSLLAKSQISIGEDILNMQSLVYLHDDAKDIVLHLEFFGQILHDAANYKPYVLTRYIFDLAQKTNSYYQKHKILSDDIAEQQAHLYLILAIKIVLHKGLELLGIDSLDQM